jgi:hypothetical protein
MHFDEPVTILVGMGLPARIEDVMQACAVGATSDSSLFCSEAFFAFLIKIEALEIWEGAPEKGETEDFHLVVKLN